MSTGVRGNQLFAEAKKHDSIQGVFQHSGNGPDPSSLMAIVHCVIRDRTHAHGSMLNAGGICFVRTSFTASRVKTTRRVRNGEGLVRMSSGAPKMVHYVPI